LYSRTRFSEIVRSVAGERTLSLQIFGGHRFFPTLPKAVQTTRAHSKTRANQAFARLRAWERYRLAQGQYP